MDGALGANIVTPSGKFSKLKRKDASEEAGAEHESRSDEEAEDGDTGFLSEPPYVPESGAWDAEF